MEEDGGVHFLTMELIEGRALAEVIPPDGLSLQELLGLALPIADALCKAHEKGIVHRDLKPANIMVDGDGRVRVLDFGLAKLTEAGGEDEETAAAGSPTEAGQLLGTVAYMSPEQAEGRTVDTRSDIFSFGIVLYEMATGQHPFQRSTMVSTLSAILKDSPQPVVELKSSAPPALGAILGRCLEKSPDHRYSSAIELRDRLRDLHTTVTSGPIAAPEPVTLTRALRRPRVALAATLVLLGAVALSAWFYRQWERARWAREVAVPEIERLLDATTGTGGLDTWRAFQLGREAERYIPEDPVLGRLRDRYSHPLTIRSDPPGAAVYAKPYAAIDEEWRSLGPTPLDAVPFVAGVLRVRIEKDGYEPVQDLFWNRVFETGEPGYVLRESGTLPEGMAFVPADGPALRIRGAPAGVHMPGVEHLPALAVGDFFVDRNEVTNAEYKRFVDAGGYETPEHWTAPFVDGDRTLAWNEAMALFVDRTERPGPATWEVGDFPEGRGDHPVTGVSWYEAAAYAAFAGKSLPTLYHWDRVALTWASGDIVPLEQPLRQRPSSRGGHDGDAPVRRPRPRRQRTGVVRQPERPRRPLHPRGWVERPGVRLQRRLRPVALGSLGDQRLPLHSRRRGQRGR